LDDYRRLTVLLTRAKCKLLLVGSKQTLAAAPHPHLQVNLPEFACEFSCELA
jgi:hypothetical protein